MAICASGEKLLQEATVGGYSRSLKTNTRNIKRVRVVRQVVSWRISHARELNVITFPVPQAAPSGTSPGSGLSGPL